ncbi:ECF-type sigma factor [Pelomonas sp. KK5]|uniref:ECF-type sigma factor n=1 Tax=Pelomonas sp. KK5 TaxID=1855730 RepID=UPI001301F06F|nr:ECF-type sigma factor [Pelomonas sp. KK5]
MIDTAPPSPARPGPTASEVTLLLRAAHGGDRQAADQVMGLLYADLRRISSARLSRSGEMSLNPTELVHESWLRLSQQGEGQDFPDRRHFLAYASRVMRSVVVDHVRARQADRRGGDLQFVTLNTAVAELAPQHGDEILRVHEALQALAAHDERLAQVVEMRYFGGLTEAEIAQALDVTERTVQRDWSKARLFLSMAMK